MKFWELPLHKERKVKMKHILCPKCTEMSLDTDVLFPRERMYCGNCNSPFTFDELVNGWGYDFGDFYGEPSEQEINRFLEDSEIEEDFPEIVYDTFEPEWKSLKERDEAYEEVTKAFLGILPEYFDTSNFLNDIPYPIGA